jgi:hypothetical protein
VRLSARRYGAGSGAVLGFVNPNTEHFFGQV